VSGIELKWNDREVLIKIKKALFDNLDEAGKFVSERARSYAPKQTGRLQRGIDYVVAEDRDGLAAFVGVTRASHAFYGRFQELGTKNMPAHPFLRPSVNNHQREILRLVKGNK